jgi:hypothetical protein
MAARLGPYLAFAAVLAPAALACARGTVQWRVSRVCRVEPDPVPVARNPRPAY